MQRNLLRHHARAASAAALFIIVGFWSSEAKGSFHLMRIEQLMAGAGGDPKIQFVELRMAASGENFVGSHTLTFYDASGNPTGTFTIPNGVANGAAGSSILIGTEEFKSASTVVPDFIMPPLMNSPNGRVTWALEA